MLHVLGSDNYNPHSCLDIQPYCTADGKGRFSKYSGVRNSRGYTGADAARAILDRNGLSYIRIEHINGELTDHYDPGANVIRLSDSVYNNDSVAAVGVAAHEAGHAVQYAEGYGPIKVRSAIIPITQFGSNLSTPLVIFGIIFSSNVLITAGILLFCTVVLFQAITLPVEFNASGRALKVLREEHFLDDDEMKGAKAFLQRRRSHMWRQCSRLLLPLQDCCS